MYSPEGSADISGEPSLPDAGIAQRWCVRTDGEADQGAEHLRPRVFVDHHVQTFEGCRSRATCASAWAMVRASIGWGTA